MCGMEVEEETFVTVRHGQVYVFCSEGCKEKFDQFAPRYTGKSSYDLTIIGGGPAGLTAGVYASIQKIDTLIVARELGGQAKHSTKVKDYLGFDFISGKELVKRFRAQLLHEHYIDHLMTEVLRLSEIEEGYEVLTREGERYRARAVIIASGMSWRSLDVPGEARLKRRGVCYSAAQEASFFAGRDVAVVGGGNSGLQAAQELAKIARHVYLITLGRWAGDEALKAEVLSLKNVTPLRDYEVREIQGKDSVEGILLQSRSDAQPTLLEVSGVFIEIGNLPNSGFAADLLELNEAGEIAIAPDCSTSRRGIFAAGDVTNAFGKRIIIACGEGAKALLSARKYLLGHPSAAAH